MKGNLRQLLTIALVFFAVVFAQAQVKTYSGVVVSAEDGQTMPGVNLKVVGTAIGTSADFDGNFTISASKGQKLEFSFVGYKNKIVVLGDATTLKITLEQDASVLDDVVIVAYGTAKKKDVTGAITTITSKDIENRQVSTVTRAIEGQVPGIQVTSSTGQPGSDATIRIRGVGSMYSSNTAMIMLDGVPYPSNVSTINPDDVESVTVLKDAASTALYGSRAANGILMITTKKGKKGDAPRVSLSVKLGSNSKAMPEYDYITDPQQYYEQSWNALRHYYGTQTGDFTNGKLWASMNLLNALGYNAYKLSDGTQYLIDPASGKLSEGSRLLYNDSWSDELYSSNFRQEYNMSITGGGDKTDYYLSVGYLSDPSYVVNSSFERISSRFNINSQVNDWFKVGATFSYTRRNSNNPGYGTSSGSLSSNDLFTWSKVMGPIYPFYARNADGSIKYKDNGEAIYDYGNGQSDPSIGSRRPYRSGYHPLTYMTKDKFRTIYDNLQLSGYAEAKFLRDFKIKATFSTDQIFGDELTFQNNEEGIASQPTINGLLAKGKSQRSVYNTNQILEWGHQYGDHRLDAMVGHEFYYQKYQYSDAAMINMLIPGVMDFSNFITPYGNPTSYTSPIALESYFARVSYNYKSKYFAEASVRRDGSSKYRYDKWGTFWAVGASWRMAEENFIKNNSNWINELKIRANIGSTGNQELTATSYPFSNLWTIGESNGDFTITQAWTGNRDLTWEKVLSMDAGVDFRFWNKFHGAIDVYRRVTTDLVFPVPQAPSTGRTSRYENDGKLANQGIELDLNYDIFNNSKVFWTVNFNLAHNKQKILRMPAVIQDQMNNGGYVNGGYLWKVGKDQYNIYYGESAGVDPETGFMMYWKDVLDDAGNVIGREKTKNYEEQTKYEQGSAMPDVIGGFNTTIRYAGFDLSINTNFQIGGWVQDMEYVNMIYFNPGWNIHKDVVSRAWTPENTNATLPMLLYGPDDPMPGQDFQNFFLRASYFNLKNVTLGYTLPARVTDKIGLSSVRVFASGENLWLSSARKGFDPRTAVSAGSQSFMYSQMRTVTFGLNVNF